MTGWYPHSTGHRTLWHPLQLHEPNTMRYLKEDGYEVLLQILLGVIWADL